MFIKLQKQRLDKVTFWDNGRGNSLGIDKIDKNSTSSIKKISI